MPVAPTRSSELRGRILAVIQERKDFWQKRLDRALAARNEQFWVDYFIDKLQELNQLEADVKVHI